MSPAESRRCIYPGCERPAVPPHPLGGPQPSFCELEEHNALTAHLERRRLAEQPGGRTPAPETVTEADRRFSDGR
jgi:hypothetical protein